MKLIRFIVICMLVATSLLGCASTIQLSSLEKPKNSSDTLVVSKFTYPPLSFGLDAGIYKIEYENRSGFFYRGPALAVQIYSGHNFNKAKYPDNKFPGGLFVPRSGDPAEYRIYYYQLNLPDSPETEQSAANLAVTQAVEKAYTASAESATAGVGAGIGAGMGVGLAKMIIDNGRGQILLLPTTSEISIASHVSKQ